LKKLEHPDICSAVTLSKLVPNTVATGCFDKVIRMWSLPKSKVLTWVNTGNYITALTFSPLSSKLIAGLINGQCLVYSSEKLDHVQTIDATNNSGYYKKGTKVTSIEFFSPQLPNIITITSNDSRIRFANISTGVILLKVKGHKNEKCMIRGSVSEDGK
jgi:WD40 repeat protein